MQVIFRVDSAYNIGTGHVMRCLSLADGLMMTQTEPDKSQLNRSLKPIFICKNHQGNLSKTIEQRGYQIYLIPNTLEPTLDTKTWLGGTWEEDVEATIKIIRNLPRSEFRVQWLVVDHYNIYLNWEQQIKKACPKIKLMSIDDFLDREHDVNIILNQTYFKNPTQIENEYRNLMVNPDTKFLIGTHYCLLNPIIQKYMNQKPQTNKILISLGGSDPENVTLKVIQNLPSISSLSGMEYHIVIGINNRHRISLIEEMKKNKNRMFLYQSLSQEEMFKMVSTSYLVIGSIGVSMYERFCLGVPMIIITIAENQQSISQELEEANLIINLGFGRNFDAVKLQEILKSPTYNGLIEKREKYQEICDGKGIRRIVKIMESYI